MKQIQVTQSNLPPLEDYIEEIKDLWESSWLTNMGEKHQRLEEALTEYLSVPQLLLFSNGHSALEAAIEAFDLTGEVITTPFTFASTTHAIVRKGLTPVFCDIDPVHYTLDPAKLESLITKKTSAIIPVHVYGNMCNVTEIERIAAKYNLKVIYDAAHAFGVTVDGKGAGQFGDAAMFSFHATKVFQTIEGGGLAYQDPDRTAILKASKNFGITGPESVEYVGGNAKLNEFQAAMGLCNLRTFAKEVTLRKQVAARYRERLQGEEGLQLPVPQEGVESNYGYFPVIFDGYGADRNEVAEKLKEHGINARKYFYPLTSDYACYRDTYSSAATPTARYIAERVLTLPIYAGLDTNEVDHICDIILSFSARATMAAKAAAEVR